MLQDLKQNAKFLQDLRETGQICHKTKNVSEVHK